MDQLALRLIDFLARHETPAGWTALAGSAALEYVFPPFPGDSVTLFGGVLVTARGWSPWFVLSAVLVGSALGSLTAFALGRAWARKRQRAIAAVGDASHASSMPGQQAMVDKLVDRFRRHGAIWLALNRFFPGVRSLFFVAAGLAGLGVWQVAFWSMVSALLWTVALLAAGALLGANFERLQSVLTTYSLVVWIALGATVCAYAVRAWRGRKTPGKPPSAL